MGFLISQSVNLFNPEKIEQDGGSIAYVGDSSAHTWRVTAVNTSGSFSSKSSAAIFVLPSGTKTAVNGTIDGDIVSVSFPAAVYSEVGEVTAFMQVFDGEDVDDSDEITTIAVLRFFVSDCNSGEIYVPEDVVMPVKTLTEKYQQLITNYGAISSVTTTDVTAMRSINQAFSVDTTNKVVDIKTAYSAGSKIVPFEIEYGTIAAQSVTDSKRTDFASVTFAKSFKSTPVVFLTILASNTDGADGRVTAGIAIVNGVNNVSKTGFVPSVWNYSSANRTVGLAWIAIGER